MTDLSFSGLAAAAAVAFLAPLLLGLAPRLRVSPIVLEIVAGIAIGPAGLGLIAVDGPINVLSVIGLAFLLFLSGLDVDLARLRGRTLGTIGLAFALSFALSLLLGFGFGLLGVTRSPLLVAIILSATALGVVTPVLEDAGEASSRVGQLVIAAASTAELVPIVLLSLFFSRASGGAGMQAALLGLFAALALAVTVGIAGAERLLPLQELLARLQDTTAQIRVRGAFLLLALFAALAERFGLEVILGTFLAGALLRLLDRDAMETHPLLRPKLDAIGYGVFVPVFFVSSGLRFDLRALAASPENLARIPLFLLALLVIRGLPAILYRPLIGGRRAVAAGLLQATSLSFIVAATRIGLEFHLLGAATAAALVAAGLLSVLLYPPAALALLRRDGAPGALKGRFFMR